MRFNELTEQSVEESGLQYYTGVKKHGKEYMTKAAQLARDGASQEELGALKDRLSKAHKGKAKNEDISEGDEQGVAAAELDEACWDSHKQVGMKKKGGKMVPNCVAKENVEEGRYDNRDAYQRDYDSSVGGMTPRDSYAYSQDGGANDERHDLDTPRPTIYGLKINGKIWQKNGNTVTFFTRERASAARNSILAKRPELEITLVQRPQD